MNPTLVAVVLVMSGVAVYVTRYYYVNDDPVPMPSHENILEISSESNAYEQLSKNCRNKTNIRLDEEKALLDGSEIASLSSEQHSYICCMSDLVISNNQFNETSFKIMSDERGWSDPYDEISEFISSCEVNGTTANKLDSCESIAPFLRCVYKKLRSHKHGSPLEVYKQYVEKCKANANIDREELVTLLEPGTAIPTLSSKQKSFVCCTSNHLISDGKLYKEGVQSLINEYHSIPSFNLSTALNACESNDTNAKTLDSCEKVAPFMLCLQDQIRLLIAKSNDIDSRASELDDNEAFYEKCSQKAGIEVEEAKALRNGTLFGSLSSAQQAFICCVNEHDRLVSNGQLNMTAIRNSVDAHLWDADNVIVPKAISACEVNGVTASALDSCEKIAVFTQCVHAQLHQYLSKPNVTNEVDTNTKEKLDTPNLNVDDQKFYDSCRLKAGIDLDEARALRNGTQFESLSSAQQTYICCIHEHDNLVSNGQLNVTTIRNVIDAQLRDVASVIVPKAISSCEINGVTATTLDSCEKIAAFTHCVHAKLHQHLSNQNVSNEVITNTKEKSDAVDLDKEADQRNLEENCRIKAGIEVEEARALHNGTQFESLSNGQQDYLCCVNEKLVSNGQLSITVVRKVTDAQVWDPKNVTIPTVISNCEANGASAKELNSCEKFAPFIHCVYAKLHQYLTIRNQN